MFPENLAYTMYVEWVKQALHHCLTYDGHTFNGVWVRLWMYVWSSWRLTCVYWADRPERSLLTGAVMYDPDHYIHWLCGGQSLCPCSITSSTKPGSQTSYFISPWFDAHTWMLRDMLRKNLSINSALIFLSDVCFQGLQIEVSSWS